MVHCGRQMMLTTNGWTDRLWVHVRRCLTMLRHALQTSAGLPSAYGRICRRTCSRASLPFSSRHFAIALSSGPLFARGQAAFNDAHGSTSAVGFVVMHLMLVAGGAFRGVFSTACGCSERGPEKRGVELRAHALLDRICVRSGWRARMDVDVMTRAGRVGRSFARPIDEGDDRRPRCAGVVWRRPHHTKESCTHRTQPIVEPFSGHSFKMVLGPAGAASRRRRVRRTLRSRSRRLRRRRVSRRLPREASISVPPRS